VERLSALEQERIEELLAEDVPFWRLRQEVPRSRYAIYRAVKRLRRPRVPEPNRSPLRLSLAEREEISRGLAAGESLRVIARRLGRTPSTVSREAASPAWATAPSTPGPASRTSTHRASISSSLDGVTTNDPLFHRKSLKEASSAYRAELLDPKGIEAFSARIEVNK
jgi:Helix-turn-helix domain